MPEQYEVVIGLEVHVELATATKIFCGCANRFGEPPNTQVCPVCLGLPGALPVFNRQALALALQAALALEARIAPRTKFDRKNYFYPDLPKAYQISQYDQPVAREGSITIRVGDGQPKRIRIHRLHLEEDAGKLMHVSAGGQIGASAGSGVDYNRAGVPLVEIVTEPDLRSPEEAYHYLSQLKAVLQYTGVSDCNMEQGSLRCDANISIRPFGSDRLGTKTEIKNMNSFKNVRAALEYEAKRQMAKADAQEPIHQETRLWDAEQGRTLPMRGKEAAHDYRYFAEPDLPEIAIAPDWVERLRQALPELPQARQSRFESAYGLSGYDAGVLTASRDLADYFEAALGVGKQPKMVCNWLSVELLGRLNAAGLAIAESPISPEHLGGLVASVESGKISGKMAKQVFDAMFATRRSAEVIIAEQGLEQIADTGALRPLIEDIISQHPGPVAELRGGKTQALGFLVGQVMKQSQGRANPKLVNKLLREILELG
jgi:aspartyl-tRNA(Asn)/glutamyl-tRNA(Gln) amidotransferase subunit B